MVRIICLVIVFVLLSAQVLAFQRTYVDLELSKDGLATEKMELTLDPFTKNNVSLVLQKKPIEIIYDSNFSLSEQEGRYVLFLDRKNLTNINLTIKRNLVEAAGNEMLLRTTYTPILGGDVLIDVELPSGFILSENSPNAVPKPDSIESDGKTIVLKWRFPIGAEAGISVFYRGENGNATNTTIIREVERGKTDGITIGVIVTGVLAAAVIIFAWAYFRRTSKEALEEVLSPEELKVVDEIRNGESKQKDIAQKLSFSKSKMSKVVRRLEEKGIVSSKPHFKTNLLKLSSRIK